MLRVRSLIGSSVHGGRRNVAAARVFSSQAQPPRPNYGPGPGVPGPVPPPYEPYGPNHPLNIVHNAARYGNSGYQQGPSNSGHGGGSGSGSSGPVRQMLAYWHWVAIACAAPVLWLVGQNFKRKAT